MKKIAFGAFLVLVVSIGFGVYYLLSNLDGIVKTAIETYGTQATQTTVRVGSVQLGLKDGSGAIRRVTIGNPQGFTAPQAFSLGEITTRIDLASLSQEVTIIEYVTVIAPEVFFELNAAGKSNLAELKQSLESGNSTSTASVQNNGVEPQLIIRKLLFAEGSIHARVTPLNKVYELKLPEFELHNLGGSKGATPIRIADQVLKALTGRALAEVEKKGLDQFKGKLEDEVNKRLGGKVGNSLKEVYRY